MGEKENDDLGLEKPVPEYFKQFYVDTALGGNVSGLMCGFEIYGVDHLLFGTDSPFGSENGLWPIRATIDSIDKLAISDAKRKMIYENNAKRLLRLS